MYKKNLETKYMTLSDISLSDAGTIEGYASRFNEIDDGGDIVKYGAYTASLLNQTSPVRMLWQHDASLPIGVWNIVKETPEGLFVSGKLCLNTEKGREALSLLQSGALDGLSVGYQVVRAIKDPTTGHRHLLELNLLEISLVTFPMLSTARVTHISPSDSHAPPPMASTDEATLLAQIADLRTVLTAPV